MALNTENTYTGNGSKKEYDLTFEYQRSADIKASINDKTTKKFQLKNATTVKFDEAPADGAAIRIYRLTQTESLPHVFSPGSSIKAKDLNDNFDQILYVSQETQRDSNLAYESVQKSEEALELAEKAKNKADEAWDKAKDALPKAGGTMSGMIRMDDNTIRGLLPPLNSTDATNKQYVDDAIKAIDVGEGGIPDAPADGKQYARKNTAWSKINIPDDVIQEAPEDGQQYARKNAAWSKITIPDGGGGGGDSNIVISENPPANPTEGTPWWSDSTVDEGGGRLYIWTGSEWVDMSQPGATGIQGPAGPAGPAGPLGPKGDANDGVLTIKDSEGTTLGSFTANQAGNTEIIIPAQGNSGGDVLPAGTRMLFAQQNPPTGWSRDTSYQGHAIKIRSDDATIPWTPSGGDLGWDNCFINRSISVDGATQNATAPSGGTTSSTSGDINVQQTAISTAQLASHAHQCQGKFNQNSGFQSGPNYNFEAQNTSASGSNNGHNHGGTFNSHNHSLSSSGQGHAHDISFGTALNMTIKYINCCIGVKN